MKFLHVPKGSGYWSGIFFLLGMADFIAAGAFFIFNIMFSAFGLMQMTGGSIIWNFSNPYIPAFIILSGGKVGLIMAILGGLLASVAEGRLWVVPTKTSKNSKSVMERKNLFILFSVIFVLYDVLSSFFFLNNGFGLDMSQGFWPGIGTFLLTLGATLLLFSIGPEMFMVWGFETMAENHEEGIPSILFGIGIGTALIKNIFSSIWNMIFGETEDETESIKQNFPQQERKNKPGRPARDYSTGESEI
jgi:hypothetical protein